MFGNFEVKRDLPPTPAMTWATSAASTPKAATGKTQQLPSKNAEKAAMELKMSEELVATPALPANDMVLVFSSPPGGTIDSNGAFKDSQLLSSFLMTDVLTTKGDLLGDNGTTPTRVPVGPDGSVLTAESSQPEGLAYTSLGPQGSILAAESSTVIGGLPVGTNGQILSANSAQPFGLQWISASGASPTANSVQYAQIGPGPATVAIGQPITYGTTSVPAPTPTNFVITTAVQGPFTASGSVVKVVVGGTYLISYQQTCISPANGSFAINYGTTLGGMLVLPYTMVGTTPAGQTGGSFLVVCAANSFIAVCAAAGNAAALNPYANASTTNLSSTTLMIMQVA